VDDIMLMTKAVFRYELPRLHSLTYENALF
jgi:hypothetical protein